MSVLRGSVVVVALALLGFAVSGVSETEAISPAVETEVAGVVQAAGTARPVPVVVEAEPTPAAQPEPAAIEETPEPVVPETPIPIPEPVAPQAPEPDPAPDPEQTVDASDGRVRDHIDQDLLDRLAAKAQDHNPGVEVAIAVVPADGELLGVSEDELFVSASAAKVYWTVVAAAIAGPDAVAPYVSDVFRLSDNGAAADVIDLVGVDSINYWLAAVADLDETALIAWPFGGSRRAATYPGPLGSDNHTTMADAASFLAQLRSFDLLDQATTVTVLHWLSLTPDGRTDDNPWAAALPHMLPERVRAATLHKAGWLPPRCCRADSGLLIDIGIIGVDDDWLAVAIAARGGDDYEGSAEWISRTGCELYRSGFADPDWSCTDQS